MWNNPSKTHVLLAIYRGFITLFIPIVGVRVVEFGFHVILLMIQKSGMALVEEKVAFFPTIYNGVFPQSPGGISRFHQQHRQNQVVEMLKPPAFFFHLWFGKPGLVVGGGSGALNSQIPTAGVHFLTSQHNQMG